MSGGNTVTVQLTPFVHVTVAGAVYVPPGQPEPTTLNGTPTLASNRIPAWAPAKVAVTVFGPSIVSASGFAAPLADPLQPEKL